MDPSSSSKNHNNTTIPNDFHDQESLKADSPTPVNRSPQLHQPNVVHEPRTLVNMHYSKVYETRELGGYQRFLDSCGKFFGQLGLIPCCVCANPWVEVQQGSVGLVTKFGQLTRVVDPGANYVNTFSEKITTVSIMTQVTDIPEQSCLTKDNVIVYLKSVIYYNIVEPQKAIFGITNIAAAVSERTQTTLRDVIGSRVLQDVIERREEIAEAIELIISEVTAGWGVSVESILIKDLRLSSEISQALSQAAQAKRIGESKIITAKAEVESAKLMRQAADILASKAAMQIRYLDAMQTMARSANSKVIFMPSSNEVGKSAEAASTGEYNDQSHDITVADASKMISMNEALK